MFEGVEVDVDVDVGGVADPGVMVVVGEEELGHHHQGIGVFHGERAGGGAVGVVGGGEPQGVFEGGPGDGVEFPVEDPGPVGEGGDLEPVAGFGRFGLDEGVGVTTPAGHHRSTWRTGSSTRVGISSGSWSANNPMVAGERWAMMASICPPANWPVV